MSQSGPPSQPSGYESAYGGYGGQLQGYGRSDVPPDVRPYVGPPLPPPTVAPHPMPPPTDRDGGPPPPVYQWPATGPAFPTPARPPQRPGVVAMAATMAVTASLQWVCALSFAWLVAVQGRDRLSTSGSEGGLYHLLNRFDYRMIDGLAWPLYLFPTAAFVVGFILLSRRPWARIVFTATGLASLAWSAWWLHTNLAWWAAPALYIMVACLIVWTPGASAWYRWRNPAAQRTS